MSNSLQTDKSARLAVMATQENASDPLNSTHGRRPSVLKRMRGMTKGDRRSATMLTQQVSSGAMDPEDIDATSVYRIRTTRSTRPQRKAA